METPVSQIKNFLRAIYTRRTTFVVVSVIVALGVVCGSFFVPKVYRAKSTVFIETNVIKDLMKGLSVSPSMNDRIRVLRYHMLSRDMIMRALKKMDMDADPRYAKVEAFEALIVKCQQQTLINVKGQDLFFVSIKDVDPYFARDYINTLVNIYVEENLANKREESYGANRFLSEQVSFYKEKLDEIDDRIIEARKQTGIFSDVSEESIMNEISRDKEALKSVKVEKNEFYATLKTMRQQLKMMQDVSTMGLNNLFDENLSSAGGQDYRIDQIQAKIDELLLVYNDQYPTVVKLKQQIEELRKRQEIETVNVSVVNVSEMFNPVEDPIFVDLKMRMNMTQSDLNALIAKQKDLTRNMVTSEALLKNFPKDKKMINDLTREKNMHQSVYEKLLSRVGVSEFSKQMEVADKSTTFRIVDPAILPLIPVGMKRVVIMLMGLLAGFASGLGAVWVMESLDNTIKSAHDLRSLGLTVLAEIPHIWSEIEEKLIKRKDRLTYGFGMICLCMIGTLVLHDLLGLTLIDQMISRFKI